MLRQDLQPTSQLQGVEIGLREGEYDGQVVQGLDALQLFEVGAAARRGNPLVHHEAEGEGDIVSSQGLTVREAQARAQAKGQCHAVLGEFPGLRKHALPFQGVRVTLQQRFQHIALHLGGVGIAGDEGRQGCQSRRKCPNQPVARGVVRLLRGLAGALEGRRKIHTGTFGTSEREIPGSQFPFQPLQRGPQGAQILRLFAHQVFHAGQALPLPVHLDHDQQQQDAQNDQAHDPSEMTAH
jgi:hypothetical protein